jgi:NitT/TauT family transport system substrate-binding protein
LRDAGSSKRWRNGVAFAGIVRFGVARLAGLGALGLGLASGAVADERPLRIVHQPGLHSIPIYVVADHKLLEKHTGKLPGGPTKLVLQRIATATGLADSILSKGADVAAGGTTLMLVAADKTAGTRQAIRGLANTTCGTLFLNSNNPQFTSLDKISPQDRIAVSQVNVSIMAILLQMQAERLWGPANVKKLDKQTVSMPQPESMTALLNGPGSGITAHFSVSPFQYLELDNPKIHRVMTSSEPLDGHKTCTGLYTTKETFDERPAVFHAFVAALDEAIAWINGHRSEAIDLYMKEEPQKKFQPAFFIKQLENKDTVYRVAPDDIQVMANFMHKVGTLRKPIKNWRDVYFDTMDGKDGR